MSLSQCHSGLSLYYTDPERFPILQREARKILDSKGAYSVAESHRHLRDMGFKTKRGALISKSVLYDLFTNPFICAQYQWAGEWHVGKWQPLVTPAEFEILQIYISGKRSRHRKHTNVYNGMIRCAECGCWVTTEPIKIKRQKNGNIHVYQYMRCTKNKGKCSQKCIRIEKLESQIVSALDGIELETGLTEFCIEQIRNEAANNHLTLAKEQELIQKLYNENEAKIANLTEKYSLGTIDDDIYVEMVKGYKQTRFRLESDLLNCGQVHDSHIDKVIRDMEFSKIAIGKFKNGSLSDKKEVLQNLESNLWLVDGNLLIDLKAQFVIHSQYNRLKSVIEPRKTAPRTAKGLYPSRWYAMSDIIRNYLRLRKLLAVF